MSDRYTRWKMAILAAVTFLLFVPEIAEFLAWKLERILSLLHR